MKLEQFFYEHPVFGYWEFAEWQAKKGITRDSSLYASIQYHVKKGRLIRLRRKLYAVVPPNLSPEELQVDPYLIVAKATKDSVLAYHTALELHGFAYSSFEQFTFLTQYKVKTFEVMGRLYKPVIFPTALLKNKNSLFGVETVNRQGVEVKITNVSRTFVDVLDRIGLSGGIEEVFRSIENIVVLNVNEVIKYCLMLKNARLAAKVGYFLEQRQGAFAVTKNQLQPLLYVKPLVPQYLSKDLREDCIFIKKWNLMIPRYLLNKLWEEPNVEV